MFRFFKAISQVGAPALLFSLCSISPAMGQQANSSDHEAVVTWSADLQGKNETPAVSTQAAAKAEFVFDFSKETAVFKMNARNLQDVSKILLRIERTPGDFKGPAIVTLYDAAKDGPFPSTYTKTFANGVFKEIADIVLNGEGIVEAFTKAHPKGEVVGLIEMHKSYK